MSAQNYFPSAEAQKAKNWEIVEQYQSGRQELARLDNELQTIADKCIEFLQYARNPREKIFEVSGAGDTIRVLAPMRNVKPLPGHKHPVDELASLSSVYVDWESLVRLIQKREEVKKAVAELKRQVGELGLSPNQFGAFEGDL